MLLQQGRDSLGAGMAQPRRVREKTNGREPPEGGLVLFAVHERQRSSRTRLVPDIVDRGDARPEAIGELGGAPPLVDELGYLALLGKAQVRAAFPWQLSPSSLHLRSALAQTTPSFWAALAQDPSH